MNNSDLSSFAGITLVERFLFVFFKSSLVLFTTIKLGYCVEKSYELLSTFVMLSFTSPLIGGYFSDRILTKEKSIIIGSILFVLAGILINYNSNNFYTLSLSLVALGSGFIRPVIAGFFGKSTKEKNNFVNYVLYINLGAFLGSCISGIIIRIFAWKVAFICFNIIALLLLLHNFLLLGGKDNLKLKQNIKAIISVVTFIFIYQYLINHYSIAVYTAYSIASALILFFLYLVIIKKSLYNNIMILILLICNVVYWAGYEQTGSSITNYIEFFIDRNIMLFGVVSVKIPTMVFFSLNPAFVVILSPFLKKFYSLFDFTKKQIYILISFSLLLSGFGFFLLFISTFFIKDSGLISFWWVISFYLSMTTGEFLLTTKILKEIYELVEESKNKNIMMSIYQFSCAFAGILAGKIAISSTHNTKKIFTIDGGRDLFLNISLYEIGFSIILILVFSIIHNKSRSSKYSV